MEEKWKIEFNYILERGNSVNIGGNDGNDGNDGEMLDDYDISAVEEVHMQCASTYGW